MDALTVGSTAAESAALVRPPIRLALLLDGLAQPAWIAEVLDRVAAERTVTLVGIGTRAESSVAPVQPSSLAYSAYRSLDVRRYGRPGDLTRLVDLVPHLGDLRTVDIPGHVVVDHWAPDAIGTERLRALGADVVWYLGTAPIVEPMPVVARLGIWTLDPVHGADGARAVSNGATTTVTTLRRVRDSGVEGETIAVARTSTKSVSVAMNQAEHVRHVAAMFEGAIGRAYRGSPAGVAPSDPVAEEPEAKVVLGAGSVARIAARIATHLVSSKWREARTTRQWLLAYHFADAAPTRATPAAGVPVTDPHLFTELAPPSDRYWADPFPIAWEGRHYLFYEETPRWRPRRTSLRRRTRPESRLNPSARYLAAAVSPVVPVGVPLGRCVVHDARNLDRTHGPVVPRRALPGRVDLRREPAQWSAVRRSRHRAR